MKKWIGLFLLLGGNLHAQSLRVAVAANAQFVIEPLRKAFQKTTGVSVEAIVSSSGKLTTQIQQGAPFDILLSADTEYPKTLQKEGLALEAPVVYAYGTLVLWTQTKLPIQANLKELLSPEVHHIAVANPSVAPYGEAAFTAMQRLKILPHLQSKVIYGESIAQVNQYVLSGAAEVGFTAKSVVLNPELEKKGRWIEIPGHLYQPIAQAVVIIKRTTKPEAARQFIRFLRSTEGKRILREYGYH
ncbi:MAG: molybdate ABC transporter substrate-binding protein [Siphonobacter sp.]